MTFVIAKLIQRTVDGHSKREGLKIFNLHQKMFSLLPVTNSSIICFFQKKNGHISHDLYDISHDL